MQNRSHKHANATSSKISRRINHVQRELARLAPPKVENEEFTVVQTYNIVPDANSIAGSDRIGRLAVTGNGVYNYNVNSSTPNPNPTVPQEAQVDLKFAMYKYWTPLFARIRVYPMIVDYQANSALSGGQTVVHQPWATVKDLDIRAESNLAALSAKGLKPFTMYAAKKHFECSYPDLDRVALQKQNTMMYLTNGSWATRQQMRDPAGIVLWTHSPCQTILPNGYGIVQIESRFRVSERVKPGSELYCHEPQEEKKTSEQDQDQPMFEHQIGDALIDDGRPPQPAPMTEEQLQRIVDMFGQQCKVKE